MGVRLLLSWLQANFAGCFGALRATPYGALLVDLNSSLYQAVARMQADRSASASAAGGRDAAYDAFERAVLHELVRSLDALIVRVMAPADGSTLSDDAFAAAAAGPRLVFIGVDGVSPLGKTTQQRERRASKAAAGARAQQRDADQDASAWSSSAWDMAAITAGTAFMRQVAAVLEWYAISRARRWPGVRIAVSDSSVAGEGEQKMFEALRAEPGACPGPVCLTSNDTDVILGATLLVDDVRYASHGVDVLRCDVTDAQSIGGADVVFDVGAFREALCDRFGWNEWTVLPSPTKLRAEEDSARKEVDPARTFTAAFTDMTLALLLFGNDYIPKLRSVDIAAGSLDHVLNFIADNFVSRAKHIVDPVTLTVDVNAALYLLSEIELLAQPVVDAGGAAPAEGGKRPRGGGLTITLGSGAADAGWSAPTASSSDPAIVASRCANYWQGLQWTVRYYCGAPTPWRWAYGHTRPPTEAELRAHPSAMQLDAATDTPVDVLAQLVVLTPPASRRRLLPRTVAAALAGTVPGLSGRDAVLRELERPPSDSIDVACIEAFCAAVRPMMTPDECSVLRLVDPFVATLSCVSTPGAVNATAATGDAGAAAGACDEGASAKLFGAAGDDDDDDGGLPGLDDDLELDTAALGAAGAEKAGADAVAGGAAAGTASGFRLSNGAPGNAFEAFGVADAALGRGDTFPAVANAGMRRGAATFKVVVGAFP